MPDPASFYRLLTRRRAWRVGLVVLCKFVILLSVFPTSAEISGRGPVEELTHYCRLGESPTATRRQSVVTAAANWLPFPWGAREVQPRAASIPVRLADGHTWENGLRAPLRL